MENSLEQHPLLKKTRWLTHALIISGALNIGFLGTFFVLTFKNLHRAAPLLSATLENKARHVYISGTAVELLGEYFEYPYEELRKELESKELVEDGYAKRDYALACLVAFHDFDLHKALSGMALQKRILEIVHHEGGERIKLEMFPGLDDAHFQALIHFSKVEKWPFTPQGLYVRMHRIKTWEDIPESLKEAFYLTPHFHYLWRMFQKVGGVVPQELLQGMVSADWESIDRCYQELSQTQNFGEESRRKFLLQLMRQRSTFAAKFFLEYDREFALTKFDDENILNLLRYVTAATPRAEAFARQLLVSVRSDKVLKSAGYKLYELAGETPPRSYDHTQTLMRFLPNFFDKAQFVSKGQQESQKISSPVQPPMSGKRYHIVVKGDSLWHIATLYHVPLKALMRTNHMTAATVIKPGMKLEIP